VTVTEASEVGVTVEELGLATRNHGMPLEALRYDVTPLGLHYLLTHYDIPAIDTNGWRLRVDGGIGEPLELSLADLRAMPAVTRRVTMECAGNGRALLDPRPVSQPWLLEAVGTSDWTGVAVADLLAQVDVADGAVEIVFSGADRGIEHGVEQHYQRSLPLDVATGPDAMLAYAVNGVALPPQHGYPLRLIVTGWYGMTNVKWLASMTAVTVPFTGYQQESSYRLRQREDEAGAPLTRMLPRALMLPPGIPDFLTRARQVRAGEHQLSGRAWSGRAPVTSVAVSADGGNTWFDAEVEPPTRHAVWQEWRAEWRAGRGSHELCCRATDAAGTTQPIAPPWNVGGYANNAVQRITVHVT
jgi:DMSO/TMAO reductase YedYZ molybdopterin-dependent catalytic subunit